MSSSTSMSRRQYGAAAVFARAASQSNRPSHRGACGSRYWSLFAGGCASIAALCPYFGDGCLMKACEGRW